MDGSFGRFWGEKNARRKSTHLLFYSKDADLCMWVAELNVGDMVLSQTDPPSPYRAREPIKQVNTQRTTYGDK